MAHFVIFDKQFFSVNSKTTKALLDLQCCVIMPTYNNAKTLVRVIDSVLLFTQNLIIVNDGATDTTAEILANYPTLDIITLPKNKGKGNALRLGFDRAVATGNKYAITIDSDGQHFASDIPNFTACLNASEDKNQLLIGARNMKQEGVPRKSSFGNKFSNFWFWFQTGVKLEDTQSGYRLYPLETINVLPFWTTKFEFEIEVIVKASWSGVIVKNIPIEVLYDTSERVSHFRPFKDFTRISILNTWFVIMTLFYIKPRDLYKKFRKKGFKRFITEDLFGVNDSPLKKALSMALGVFIGISPLWGFHTALVIFLSVALRLNKVIAFAFSNVSLPPFIPFVVYGSLQIGSWIMDEPISYSIESITENFEILPHLKIYLVGSFSLAIIAALVVGFIGFVLFSLFSKKKDIVHG